MTATLSPRPLTEELEPARAGWITEWRPEDDDFWATTGRRVARRNLIFSIFAEHLGFSVWVLWSVLVVVLGTHPNDFPFLNPKVTANADKIFWLVALPNLIGALMRLPYTVAVLRFGGRNWTVVSALLLMIPIALATYCVTHPGTPYWFFLLTAATAGFGGGNFASSMTNIAFFYPERLKGTALGLNAAGGNIGLSSMQFVVPLLIFYNAAMVAAPLFWLPLVLAAAVCAYLFMNNLHVSRTPVREQLAVTREPQAWVMSFLYIGTFGSFLGLAAAIRAADAKSLSLFLTTMLVLFTLAGFGNGSTYKMIPAIFKRQAMLAGRDDTAGFTRAVRLGSTTLGMAGAIGALGGFYMPRAIGNSIKATGGITQAFTIFFVMYVVCLLVTALCYLRPGARLRGV